MKDPRGPQGERGNDAEARDRSGIPEEWLAPFLLLCLRDGDSYGHRLEERLGELDFFDGTRPGQMYRTLWHMEQEGIVLCDREDGEFRLPQRRYEITEVGEAQLESWANSLVGYQEEVNLFIRLYDQPRPAQRRSRG